MFVRNQEVSCSPLIGGRGVGNFNVTIGQNQRKVLGSHEPKEEKIECEVENGN
jgi:hypothetical protein